MGIAEFEQIRHNFQSADVEGKIDIYIDTEDLTKGQYRELLQMFPVSELYKLEEALK